MTNCVLGNALVLHRAAAAAETALQHSLPSEMIPPCSFIFPY